MHGTNSWQKPAWTEMPSSSLFYFFLYAMVSSSTFAFPDKSVVILAQIITLRCNGIYTSETSCYVVLGISGKSNCLHSARETHCYWQSLAQELIFTKMIKQAGRHAFMLISIQMLCALKGTLSSMYLWTKLWRISNFWCERLLVPDDIWMYRWPGLTSPVLNMRYCC